MGLAYATRTARSRRFPEWLELFASSPCFVKYCSLVTAAIQCCRIAAGKRLVWPFPLNLPEVRNLRDPSTSFSTQEYGARFSAPGIACSGIVDQRLPDWKFRPRYAPTPSNYKKITPLIYSSIQAMAAYIDGVQGLSLIHISEPTRPY